MTSPTALEQCQEEAIRTTLGFSCWCNARSLNNTWAVNRTGIKGAKRCNSESAFTCRVPTTCMVKLWMTKSVLFVISHCLESFDFLKCGIRIRLRRICACCASPFPGSRKLQYPVPINEPACIPHDAGHLLMNSTSSPTPRLQRQVSKWLFKKRFPANECTRIEELDGRH